MAAAASIANRSAIRAGEAMKSSEILTRSKHPIRFSNKDVDCNRLEGP